MQPAKAVDITYFVHGTTTDNEQKLASGWFDAKLSGRGKKQCTELRKSIDNEKFDIVFCSDLKRAAESARIAFPNANIIQDKRLRECNYGDLTRADSKKVESLTAKHIDNPFPNGESYEDVERRMKSFLDDILKDYSGKNVAIVAHKASQLALDVLLKGKTWERAIKEDWRLKTPPQWKPGWKYVAGENR